MLNYQRVSVLSKLGDAPTIGPRYRIHRPLPEFSCTPLRLTRKSRWNKLQIGRLAPKFSWNLNSTPNLKLWRLLGTSARLWSNALPNAKSSRLSGSFTPSRLRLKASPNLKLLRLLGKVTPSRLWLKQLPKVKVLRLLGNSVFSKLWLKWNPKVRCCSVAGNRRKLRSKKWPKLKVSRRGRFTPSKLWLKSSPNFKIFSKLGNWTPCKSWSKKAPNVKLSRLLGHLTRCSRCWKSSPKERHRRYWGHWTCRMASTPKICANMCQKKCAISWVECCFLSFSCLMLFRGCYCQRDVPPEALNVLVLVGHLRWPMTSMKLTIPQHTWKARQWQLQATPSRLWLNSSPKLKHRKLSGSVAPSKLRLKWPPKVKLCKRGKVTRCHSLMSCRRVSSCSVGHWTKARCSGSSSLPSCNLRLGGTRWIKVVL